MITMSKISICTAHNSANDEKTDMIKSNHGLLTLVLSRGMKDLLNECEIGKLCSAVVQRMINISAANRSIGSTTGFHNLLGPSPG